MDHLATAVLATAPVFTGRGPSAGAVAVLRLQVLNGPDGHAVMLGGVGRVLAPGDFRMADRAAGQGRGRRCDRTATRGGDGATGGFRPSVPAAADALYCSAALPSVEVAARTARLSAYQLTRTRCHLVADGTWQGVAALPPLPATSRSRHRRIRR